MERIIHRTFQVPTEKATALEKAIAKVLQNIPQSAPESTVKKTDKGIRFDVRHIPKMVWDRTKISLNEMGAKEVEVTYVDEVSTWKETL